MQGNGYDWHAPTPATISAPEEFYTLSEESFALFKFRYTVISKLTSPKIQRSSTHVSSRSDRLLPNPSRRLPLYPSTTPYRLRPRRSIPWRPQRRHTFPRYRIVLSSANSASHLRGNQLVVRPEPSVPSR